MVLGKRALGKTSGLRIYTSSDTHPNVRVMVVKANFGGMTPLISTLSVPLAYTLISRTSRANALISDVVFSRLSDTRSLTCPLE